MLRFLRTLCGAIAALSALAVVIVQNVIIHPVDALRNVEEYGYVNVDAYLQKHNLSSVAESVDYDEFKLASDGFALDRHHVYIQDEVLAYNKKEDDLEKIYDAYIEDYMSTLNLPKAKIDLKTLRIIETEIPLLADRKHVYLNTTKLSIADPKTLKSFGANSAYAIDKKRGYCLPAAGKKQLIPGTDYETFRYLGLGYAIDENYVYYQCMRVVAANPETFSVYEMKYDGETEAGVYARDDSAVYLGSKVIQWADPKSFRILAKGHYAKDDNYIYYHGMRINNAHPESFRLLSESTSEGIDAQDKNYRYKQGVPQIW